MASKQPRRSDMTLDLKFIAQTRYATMFVWTVLALFWKFVRKMKERKTTRLYCRVARLRLSDYNTLTREQSRENRISYTRLE